MNALKFKHTGLLVGLESDESEFVDDLFEKAVIYENTLPLDLINKPVLLPFIRRVYNELKVIFNPQLINVDEYIPSIVDYIYENIKFSNCLHFLKNSDQEAEFYGLLARDYARKIKAKHKKKLYGTL